MPGRNLGLGKGGHSEELSENVQQNEISSHRLYPFGEEPQSSRIHKIIVWI